MKEGFWVNERLTIKGMSVIAIRCIMLFNFLLKHDIDVGHGWPFRISNKILGNIRVSIVPKRVDLYSYTCLIRIYHKPGDAMILQIFFHLKSIKMITIVQLKE